MDNIPSTHSMLREVHTPGALTPELFCVECGTIFPATSPIDIFVHFSIPAHRDSNVEPATYTETEVRTILARHKATPLDYVARTVTQLLENDDDNDDDDEHNKENIAQHKRRFNNLKFSNFERTSRQLITDVLMPKLDTITADDLMGAAYVGIICHHINSANYCIVAQYFDPSRGIEHRVLDYVSDAATGLADVVGHFDIAEKFVGYCGDFSLNSQLVLTHSPQFHRLNNAVDQKVHYLAYCDNALDHIFEQVCSYLGDIDIAAALIDLAEFLKKQSHHSYRIKCLIETYDNNMSSKTKFFGSFYARFIQDNFDQIRDELFKYKYLPKHVALFFNDIKSEFFLAFGREIYRKFATHKTHGSFAVGAYTQTRKLIDLLKTYYNNAFIPPNAESAIDDFNLATYLPSTQNFYKRAEMLLETILPTFPESDVFSWVLLDENALTRRECDKIHATYHIIHRRTCPTSECIALNEEITKLATVLRNMALVERSGLPADENWVFILAEARRCDVSLHIIPQLLEYIFSLPSSFERIPQPNGARLEAADNVDDRMRNKFKMNFKIAQSHFLDIVDEYFDDSETQLIGNIVDEFDIPLLED